MESWKQVRRFGIVAGLWLLVFAPLAPDPARAAGCETPTISTRDGCANPATVERTVLGIVRDRFRADRLQAVVARVDVRGRTVLRRGFGQSETGVPVTPAMNFRIGSMTIPVLTNLVYKLREAGRLRLTDPVSRWLPGLPRSGEVSVRDLMNNTSGYYDWIQGNQDFQDQVLNDPFRLWTERELLQTALSRGSACSPGSCFSYAHTNFLILARVVRKIMRNGTLVANLKRRILRPLGIDLSFSRLAPIPAPALGAYTDERGVFEQTTGWSPSWGLGNGMLATANIDAVARIAKGVLSGSLLAPGSRKDLVKRYAPGIGPKPDRVYFGQGLILANGWRRQNPFFNGYMGNVAWFPKRRIAISLVGTSGPATAVADGVNVTDAILDDIAAYLTPNNAPSLSGSR